MPQNTDESIPDVMMRIAAELYDVADLIETIEPIFNDIHCEAVPASADDMKVLQGIDLAVQKARGLAKS